MFERYVPKKMHIGIWPKGGCDFNSSSMERTPPSFSTLLELPHHAIGNSLGNYIDKSDPKWMFACVFIHIEVNLEKGLPKEKSISLDNWTPLQKRDYEHFPFKCGVYHEYDNFT